MSSNSLSLLFDNKVLSEVKNRFPCDSLDIFNANDFNIDLKKLDILGKLANGSYGDVHHGVYNDRKVAIKVIEILPTHNIQEIVNILIELSLMQSLPHDKLVKYAGAGYRSSINNGLDIIILMELCENGSLRKYLQSESSLSWKLRARLLLDAAKGILFLHENEVIHRDIKTANILVDRKRRAKLCDMSFACHINSTNRTEFSFGTTEFMAPEIALAYNCGFEADIFSLGIIFCEMITGMLSYLIFFIFSNYYFLGKEPSKTFLNRHAKNRFQVNEFDISNNLIENCPTALEALAYQCCDVDLEKRPNIMQVIEELEAILSDLGDEDTIDGDDFNTSWNSRKSINFGSSMFISGRTPPPFSATRSSSAPIPSQADYLEKDVERLKQSNMSLEERLNELTSSFNLNISSEQVSSFVDRVDSIELKMQQYLETHTDNLIADVNSMKEDLRNVLSQLQNFNERLTALEKQISPSNAKQEKLQLVPPPPPSRDFNTMIMREETKNLPSDQSVAAKAPLTANLSNGEMSSTRILIREETPKKAFKSDVESDSPAVVALESYLSKINRLHDSSKTQEVLKRLSSTINESNQANAALSNNVSPLSKARSTYVSSSTPVRLPPQTPGGSIIRNSLLKHSVSLPRRTTVSDELDMAREIHVSTLQINLSILMHNGLMI